MKESNRVRKNDIKYNIQLNEEQKQAKQLIIDNQIVIITGRAGSGKSLLAAQAALDFLLKKECEQIFITRPAIEVGNTLGYLPGELSSKMSPYIEALIENLKKCYDSQKIDGLMAESRIKGFPVQFIRGHTIDDVLLVEEASSLTKHEMLAILTRLGKNGKIIINGDNNQMDIKVPTGEMNGLSYAIELSKAIPEIKWVKLKENHRSGLVGKILDYEYGK